MTFFAQLESAKPCHRRDVLATRDGTGPGMPVAGLSPSATSRARRSTWAWETDASRSIAGPTVSESERCVSGRPSRTVVIVGAELELIGAGVRDAGGAEVAKVRALLVDPVTGAGRWLAVELSDGATAVVPVEVASIDGSGQVALPYSEATLRAAPVSAGAMVTEDEATRLLEHYGLT